MEALETGLGLMLIAAVLPFIAIIVFFVMADNVIKIRKRMDEVTMNLMEINHKLSDQNKELTT